MELPKKQGLIKQFEVNGHPAVLTMTFSYHSSRVDGEGITMECSVEDCCLRYFDGEKWNVIISPEEELKKCLLQNINDGILTTESIVNELAKREGVQEIVVGSHQPFIIQVKGSDDNEFSYPSDVKTGPARILVVID